MLINIRTWNNQEEKNYYQHKKCDFVVKHTCANFQLRPAGAVHGWSGHWSCCVDSGASLWRSAAGGLNPGTTHTHTALLQHTATIRSPHASCTRLIQLHLYFDIYVRVKKLDWLNMVIFVCRMTALNPFVSGFKNITDAPGGFVYSGIWSTGFCSHSFKIKYTTYLPKHTYFSVHKCIRLLIQTNSSRVNFMDLCLIIDVTINHTQLLSSHQVFQRTDAF